MGKTVLLAAAAIALSAWFFVAFSAPEPGYCGTRATLLSDRYLKVLAVRVQSRTGDLSLGSFASAAEYVAGNPKCCRVQRREIKSLREKLFGLKASEMPEDFMVELIYKTQVPDSSAEPAQRFHLTMLDIDSCGRIKDIHVMGRQSLELE